MTFEEWLEFYSPGTAFTEGEKAPLHAAWLAGAAQRPEEVATRWKTTAKHLPEEGSTVLGCWGIEGPGHMAVVTYSGGNLWHDPEDDEDDYRAPEHWTPLPSSPPQHGGSSK